MEAGASAGDGQGVVKAPADLAEIPLIQHLLSQIGGKTFFYFKPENYQSSEMFSSKVMSFGNSSATSIKSPIHSPGL